MDTSSIRVLLIDDDEDDYRITIDVLSDVKVQAYEVDWVSTYDSALEAVVRNDHDICLVDYNLGEYNGLDLIKQALLSGCQAPMILLTGQGDHDLDVEAMRAGASDYLSKNKIDEDLLERTIRYSIERKRAQETLRRIEAEKQDRERKHLVEQLQHSQKVESIGRLVGGVAHDFNNLLTAIQAYAQLSLMTIPDDESRLRSNIQEVENQVKRAANLTNQLLIFSRRQTIEPKAFNLYDMIVEMSKMLRRLIGEDIELVILVESDTGYVLADLGQMEQVLTNLAVNAGDAMPEGGKLIIETANISIEEADKAEYAGVLPGEYVTMSVTDTGIGMDSDTIAQVFEPFFTTKKKGEGTGLGLSTSHDIVTNSGGHILVKSELGQGTTFTVLMPRVAKPAEIVISKDETYNMPRGDETIVLAEDDPSLQRLISNVLRGQGYTVYQAGNGAEAMRIALEHQDETIHLLWTDIVMPLMGGNELAVKLKQIHPETKVLFCSGYNDESIVRSGMPDSEGFFLSKPFSLSTLATKVRAAIDSPGVVKRQPEVAIQSESPS